MSEESRSNLWVGILAVVVIAATAYFLFRPSQTEANLPEINMSREELLKGAMVDGPGTAPPEKAPTTSADKNLKTITPRQAKTNP